MHKHKLAIERTSDITIKATCKTCGQKFTYLRSAIYTMLLWTHKYKPSYLLGHW